MHIIPRCSHSTLTQYLQLAPKQSRRTMSQLSESLRVHATSQTSFTSNAVLYDKARPSYIPSAVEAVIRMTKLQAESKLLDLV